MDNRKQKQRRDYKRRWQSADRLLKRKKSDISEDYVSTDQDNDANIQQSLALSIEEKKTFSW